MISADKDVDNGTVVQRNVFVNIQQQTCVQTLLAAAAAMRVLHISRRRITALYSCSSEWSNKLCGRPPQYAPPPSKLAFDLLTLKVVSESRAIWATSVPILVFLKASLFST